MLSIPYEHLLSPIKVGNMVLKNRMVSSNALPHFLQGPEPYPAEPVINHMVDMAKNGAAVVTFADWTLMTQRESLNEDGKRFPMYNLDADPSVENYMCQLADQIHYYNSRISLAIMPFYASYPGYDVNDEPAAAFSPEMIFGNQTFGGPRPTDAEFSAMMRGGAPVKAFTHDQIRELIETYAQRALKYKTLGFDMCTLHFAYRATLFARFLSAATNHRTDEYGGDIHGRGRFMLELCTRIKELCGKDFPIEIQITADDSAEGGNTIEETIELAKMVEDVCDIWQFRAETANLNHPVGYNSKEHIYLELEHCARVKASGVNILCEPIGGFQNPDDMEAALASGKADLIGGARMFMCDFDFYDKIKENRAEDIVPCIRCNKCHVPSDHDEWLSYCSVNPCLGLAHRIDKLTRPVGRKRSVAVVGGGPAGMRAALYARERGYDCTLFEAKDHLGGQLCLFDDASFKWPLVKYRKWLIQQLEKSGAVIRMNTKPTKQMLAEEGFDAVILAMGAVPRTPAIPGADKAYNIFTVFGNEGRMGHKCVVVGGSESGTEAALYLAEHGHEVVVLTRGSTLAPEATPIHYREMMEEYYAEMKDISYVSHAVTTEIGEGFVKYADQDGVEHTIACDDTVVLGGMAPKQDEAVELYGVAPDTLMIGDCYQVANLHALNRGAFSAIHNL